MPEIKIRTHAKVLVSLSRRLHTSQQNSVRARWCAEGEQVQDRSFTTSSDDAVLCSLGEAQSGNGYFGNGGQADVIGHYANLDEDLGGEVGGWPTHSAMLKWRVVLAAAAESSQNLTGGDGRGCGAGSGFGGERSEGDGEYGAKGTTDGLEMTRS